MQCFCGAVPSCSSLGWQICSPSYFECQGELSQALVWPLTGLTRQTALREYLASFYEKIGTKENLKNQFHKGMSVLKVWIVLDSLNDRIMIFNCLTNVTDCPSNWWTFLSYFLQVKIDMIMPYFIWTYYICIVNCYILKQTVSLRDWWGTTISFHILLRIPEFCELGQDFISIKPGPSDRCVPTR